MSSFGNNSTLWNPVPISVIMTDYCSSSEQIKAYVEAMKNVIVYVEARLVKAYGAPIRYSYETENITDILTIAGVRVKETLERNITHVIFSHGRLETYRKAKLWNIPLVNEHWFESCMSNHRVCDPTEFPISCWERYEDPAEHVNIQLWMDPSEEQEPKRARME